jgi:hypothetical protein
MGTENWKLWLAPFAVWGAVMAWYSGYQAGYQEGHETAWQMSRPKVMRADEQLVLSPVPDSINERLATK